MVIPLKIELEDSKTCDGGSVDRAPAKVETAGSSPVWRSHKNISNALYQVLEMFFIPMYKSAGRTWKQIMLKAASAFWSKVSVIYSINTKNSWENLLRFVPLAFCCLHISSNESDPLRFASSCPWTINTDLPLWPFFKPSLYIIAREGYLQVKWIFNK